ncbi:hypothetical protein ZIOFF_073033 [Zingiber officinale]|uniref:2-oxo-4-hydroxy-4-carboxy-5-ureidoimidazoline decarboxylase n=1 Tax=Zingiber officinale TaxID=94328 RepID=A0A8J5ETL3_ZINOF|nr:hypothetical protein ZIOFF_073033 [Zingiber officinale]
MASFSWIEEDVLRCCGSKHFAKELASALSFSDLHHAIQVACGFWFNKVAPLPPSSLFLITLTNPFPHLLILQIDVVGWLEAFATHPPIGSISPSVSQWSKEEQSAAMATANDNTLQELVDWNIRYQEKCGFVFLIYASGRGTLEILVELKDSPASPSVAVALAGTTDGPANDEGNLSDAKALAKEVAFLFQNWRFQEYVEILSQIFYKKRGDAKVLHNIILLLLNTFEMVALILGISLMH